MKPSVLRKGKTPQEGNRPYIKAISLDLTEDCSLRCDYCFCDTEAKKGSGRHLSIETGKEVIDWLFKPEISGPNNMLHIEWWGGEPFTRFKELRILCKYAQELALRHKKQVTFSATTNIVSLNREKLQWAHENNCGLLYSIDGTKDRNRLRKLASGEDSWPVMEKKIKVISDFHKEKAFPPQYRMTVDPRILDGMVEDVKWLGSQAPNTDVVFSENYDIEWTEEDYIKYASVLRSILAYKLEMLEKNTFVRTEYLDMAIDSNLRNIFKYANVNKRYNCGAGKHYVGISIEGAIYPCHRCNKHNTTDIPWSEKERCLGSIYENFTNDELDTKLQQNLLNTHDDMSTIKKCMSCDIKDTCGGTCIAVNKDTTGKWEETTDNACRIRHILYGETKVFTEQLFNKALFAEYNKHRNVVSMIPGHIHNEGANGCTCYASKYINPAEYLKLICTSPIKEVANKTTDETKLYVMARDIIDMMIMKSTKVHVPGCGVYQSTAVSQNHINTVDKNEQIKILQKLCEILDE